MNCVVDLNQFSNLQESQDNMDIAKSLLGYIKKFIEISDEEFRQYIYPHITIRKFAKKQIITHAGEIEGYFNFIAKGLVRKYYKRGKEEINTQISYEGQIILSQDSFGSRMPSEYYVEAIEPTTLISISYNELEKIYSYSGKFERLGRLIITYIMVIQDRWQSQLVMHSPRERFIKFVNKNPELLQRVPQKYLASFLNIKPETFSRFKHLVKGSSKKTEAA